MKNLVSIAIFIVLFLVTTQPKIYTIMYHYTEIENVRGEPQKALLVDIDARADSMIVEYTFWYQDTVRYEGEEHISFDMVPADYEKYYNVTGLVTDTVRLYRGAHDMDIDVRAWKDGKETRKGTNVIFER